MKPPEFQYHDKLKGLMNEYVHGVFLATRTFPKEELYGATSQLRRSSLSVILNYIEGFARGRVKVNKNFLEISYGSLKESDYLLDFSKDEGFLSQQDYQKLKKLSDEIGAMTWKTIQKI